MNKKIISIVIIFILLFSSCNIDKSPLSPKAKNNQEAMEYVTILREEFTLIKPHLEILRNGKVGKEGYSLSPNINGEIYLYEGRNSYLLSENAVNLPILEITTIEYLFFSDELKENASYLNYGKAYWHVAIGTQGGMFAETQSSIFNIGIFYFEDNKIPEELQNKKEYLEELEDNYWIVACNMKRE